jgi:UDP-glucose 4-epimerase
MRVLVTGGAGFIGSHVVEALHGAGDEVAVVDNLSTGKRDNVPPGVKLYEVDLRDREATRKAIRDFKPDAVSHQAAQASVAVSVRDPRLDADVNIMGGIHLLDACVEAGVRRVVFASTGGAIYGEIPEGVRAVESFTPGPKSPYAISKYALELLLGVYREHRDMEPFVLRYANVYGPRQDPHGEAGVVAIFFALALAGGTLRVNARNEPGDPGCVRDYVYVGDVARANLLALSGKLGESVINIASGTATTTEELARRILEQVKNPEARLEHAPRRPGDLERSVLDPGRSLRVLSTLTPLDEGLRRTLEHYRHSR